MVHLSCEKGERYLRFIQANGGEEISSAEVVKIDTGAANSASAPIAASSFDIEVFVQSHTSEEVLSSG